MPFYPMSYPHSWLKSLLFIVPFPSSNRFWGYPLPLFLQPLKFLLVLRLELFQPGPASLVLSCIGSGKIGKR